MKVRKSKIISTSHKRISSSYAILHNKQRDYKTKFQNPPEELLNLQKKSISLKDGLKESDIRHNEHFFTIGGEVKKNNLSDTLKYSRVIPKISPIKTSKAADIRAKFIHTTESEPLFHKFVNETNSISLEKKKYIKLSSSKPPVYKRINRLCNRQAKIQEKNHPRTALKNSNDLKGNKSESCSQDLKDKLIDIYAKESHLSKISSKNLLFFNLFGTSELSRQKLKTLHFYISRDLCPKKAKMQQEVDLPDKKDEEKKVYCLKTRSHIKLKKNKNKIKRVWLDKKTLDKTKQILSVDNIDDGVSEIVQLTPLGKDYNTIDNRRFSLNTTPIKLNSKNMLKKKIEIVKFIKRSAVHPKIAVQNKKITHEHPGINKETKLRINSCEPVRNTLEVNQKATQMTLQKQSIKKNNDSQSLRIQNMIKTMLLALKLKCSKRLSSLSKTVTSHKSEKVISRSTKPKFIVMKGARRIQNNKDLII
ncbi:unnamed protein product [Moneuplotes crassus]|uniref:Uncharacterized protein n=1 Tax=Euplotes crassus TaxID=5936 RepID=A0AAD2D9G3_EUPCR|nr:unnamed protein product [Moneuplotes crassus]